MALVKDIQDRVREVAYLMWESAGRQHGMAMEYWLAAERDVISTMQSAAERMMPGQARGSAGAAEALPQQASEPRPASRRRSASARSRAGACAVGAAEPVSQASEAVVEATPAIAEASEAAGSTAAAAKAAAKPTRKATARAKRTRPPGTD